MLLASPKWHAFHPTVKRQQIWPVPCDLIGDVTLPSPRDLEQPEWSFVVLQILPITQAPRPQIERGNGFNKTLVLKNVFQKHQQPSREINRKSHGKLSYSHPCSHFPFLLTCIILTHLLLCFLPKYLTWNSLGAYFAQCIDIQNYSFLRSRGEVYIWSTLFEMTPNIYFLLADGHL